MSSFRDRYQGKPLLLLLESYVLDCIGHFPADKTAAMVSIVQKVYGGDEDWKATLRSTLHLDKSLDENLRQLWVRNQVIAKEAGETLGPIDFARMIVDRNFAAEIDG
jgi:hypothetical protein